MKGKMRSIYGAQNGGSLLACDFFIDEDVWISGCSRWFGVDGYRIFEVY